MLSISGNSPAFLASFMIALLSQINDPSYKTHLDYQFSPDFLLHGGITFRDGVEVPINSACEDGPNGNIPPMDFIIVGGGVAGSVLANKLATDFPSKTVLLIEAGNDGHVNSVPAGLFFFNVRTESNYEYHAEKSSNYSNLFETGAMAHAGRGLGGSSLINNNQFVCGTDADFDSWAELTEDPIWNAENMFKNLREFTNVADDVLMSDPECQKYLGTNGPLTVTHHNDSNAENKIPLLLKAAESAGYEILKDINCGKYVGFTPFRATIKDGERNTAARAFLAPMRNRRNLLIMRNSKVDKVIMKDVEVVGVKVQTKRPECSEFEIHANHEVIISAGTYNSPGILLRSGTGRKVDLDKIGVQQVLDLPVGYNYRNHISTLLYIAFPNNIQPIEPSDIFNEYLNDRKGPYSHYSVEDMAAFISLSNDSLPDIQWVPIGMFEPGSFNSANMRYFGDYKLEYFDVLNALTTNNTILNFINVVLQPKSSGQVTTKDRNPIIYANYLSHPDDIETMIGGIRKLEEFVNSPFMKSLNASIVNMNVPECNQLVYASDDYWKCFLKIFSTNAFHPVGTNRMGKVDDPEAVVDSRLNVIGVKGSKRLRVVDASVMPQVPRANTMCPTYNVAWNAAKMIIEDNSDDGGDGNSGSKKVLHYIFLAVPAILMYFLILRNVLR